MASDVEVSAVGWSADGNTLVAAAGREVAVWTLERSGLEHRACGTIAHRMPKEELREALGGREPLERCVTVKEPLEGQWGRIQCDPAFHCSIPADLAARILTTPSLLLKQGRSRQLEQGFRVTRMGGLLRQLGLRDRDVFTHIDGVRLESPAIVTRVLLSLVGKTEVTIVFMRGAEERTLRLSVVDTQ
ncbi:MAG: hypothetical protein K0V04_37600 [Deltaproteobacteria bacterium]|nr:hypothetical protein [Deltaproteobacteria bacterium]